MIDPAYVQRMARYNRWQNANLYGVADTLSDEVEPYLLRRHFIVRSPRGRRATAQAYRHIGLPEPPAEIVDPLLDPQRRLFE